MTEQDLEPQFDRIIKAIQIVPSMQDWMTKALKWSRHEEQEYQRQTLSRLQVELSKVNLRLDALYLDKLDGKVSEQFWMEKSKQWEADKARIFEELNNCRVSDDQAYLQGVKILELAAKAHELYKKQNSDEKNKFLRILLSNCTLDNGTVRPVYRKPFDILAKGVESKNWGE